MSDHYVDTQRHRRKIEILCEEQNHRCCYCGVEMLSAPPYLGVRKRKRWISENQNNPRMRSVEHVIRRVEGGWPEWENEVAACLACNTGRGHFEALFFFNHRERILALRLADKEQRRRERRRKFRKMCASGVQPLACPV